MSKKNDDISNGEDTNIHTIEQPKEKVMYLNEDKVVEKVRKLQEVLGVPEDEIRQAIKEVNMAQKQRANGVKEETEEPINYVKLFEYVFLFCVIIGSLYFANHESNGEVVDFIYAWFPKEMATLGFVRRLPVHALSQLKNEALN